MTMMRYLVTGGAGFIGSNLARRLLESQDATVVVYDALTYAGNLESLEGLLEHNRFRFVNGDLCDRELLAKVLREHSPDAVLNLAAESHVDRSIDGPRPFVRTNLQGTFELLDAARLYWLKLDASKQRAFRFLHVSTDEVYGSLGPEGYFTEQTPYAPNSPYAASKAGADHLVRAYFQTYGLPTMVTNCSNNFGPYQFPEKLIPLTILNAIEGKRLPVYGDGKNVRDWLFVVDHCDALILAAAKGTPGECYNVGARNERSTVEIVESVCEVLDEARPLSMNPATLGLGLRSYRDLIEFVRDRPGHDRRYAIDASKIERDLGWSGKVTFSEGIRATVLWYLENASWWKGIEQRGVAARERLGLDSVAQRRDSRP